MPKPSTYASHELGTTRDGLAIYGQLFVPANLTSTSRLPTLVCAHGFGANYLSCVAYAWALAERGFAVYCFDFCGGGYASRSAGNPLEMTIHSECRDLAAVVGMLKTYQTIDADRISILGEDQGGLAGALFAAQHPDAVHSLVLVSATLNQHDLTRRLFPTKKNIPASYRHLGMRVGKAYGEAMWDTNPYAHMRAYEGEVLVVQGDEDVSVPLDYAQRAASVYPHARLEVIRAGAHALRGAAQQQAICAVTRFLLKD